MKSIITCVPNPIANKTNSHFRGRMEIMARAIEYATGEEVIVSTSANQWDLMHDPSVKKTYLHLGDSYGGPELGGWNWNEYGRMSEDPETYKWWLFGVEQVWTAIKSCQNPVALEFPFPDKFKFMASSTLRRPEWKGTKTLQLFEEACQHLANHGIHSEANSIRRYYDPWIDCVLGGWDGVVLGDSHGLSVWRDRHALIYRKGETLHGATRRGFKSILSDVLGDAFVKVKKGVFNYGNIDIRHHVCRFPIEPTLEKLVLEYSNQIKDLNFDNVTIAAPFPINADSRVISKSIMYRPKVMNEKGKMVNGELLPFSGSWSERDRAYRYFDYLLKETCRMNSWNYHEWPSFFKTSSGEFNPEVMEGGRKGSTNGRGIHLSPEFYYWNPFTNRKNEYTAKAETNAMENFFS